VRPDGLQPPRGFRRGRVGIWVATSVAVLALGLGIPLFSDLTGLGGPFWPIDPSEPAVGAIPVVRLSEPVVGSSVPVPTGSPVPVPSTRSSPTGSTAPRTGTPATPVPGQLRAHYRTTGPVGTLGIDGYEGEVTVSNPGGIGVTGWTVTLTLPAGQTLADASGVHYRQDGTTVTFTPIGRIRWVPAQGSVRFTLTVRATFGDPPTSCAINGRPCD
jgi:Cellulose binding domain